MPGEERALKIECAKLQATVKALQDDIEQLTRNRDRSAAMTESQKIRAQEEAKASFAAKQQSDIRLIEEKCADMRGRADALLDTFPELRTKEFAGKYEIKEIEAKLAEVYPKAMLDSYMCLQLREFDTEGQAYATYVSVERGVASLRQGSIVSALFTGITGLLSVVCKDDGMGGKVALGAVGIIALSFVVSPFVFMAIFTLIGLAAAVQGLFVRHLLRGLYSVKAFLNEAYDEDIFQEDKSEIMAGVEEYLEGVKSDYIEEVKVRKFVMNPRIIQDIETNSKIAYDKLCDTIQVKQQQLLDKQKEAALKLEELDAAVKKREEAAKRARQDYLETIDWKREWVNTLLLDVTKENRIQGCRWLQANSLYVSRDVNGLQNFWQLAIYQGMLHMHPDYAGQVVIDYKYMGSNLVQFSRVISSLFSMVTDKEEIDKKLSRIKDDIRARCNNILKSCESIEDFNKLMSTYNATGESYVIVHICGLQGVSADLKLFLKNGPKVGYFFKIYATMEEFKEFSKDFPFDDVTEYAEVDEMVTPRTLAQMRRFAEQSA